MNEIRPTSPLLEAKGLTVRFRRGADTLVALDSVDFSIAHGETFAIVGQSGSGKSTLARVVMRLLKPDAGSFYFAGRDLLGMRGSVLRSQRRRFQMVFQDPIAALNPRSTVGRAVADPLRIHAIVPRAERHRAVESLLEMVELPNSVFARQVHELSGGQRQRVALARALASRPELIVLDEALSALDMLVRAEMVKLLSRLKREHGIAYVFISHDLALVRSMADRVAVMAAGRIVEIGDASAVIDYPTTDAGRTLVAAAPRLPIGAWRPRQ